MQQQTQEEIIKKMKHSEFCRLIEGGSITDFKPFIATKNTAFREEIAKTGQCIDELLAYNEPSVIEVLIDNGFATEHYDEWKTYSDARVRAALARRGLWPELFIQDTKWQVRMETIRKNPELMHHGLNRSVCEWQAVRNIIESNPNVTLDDLNAFLSAKHNNESSEIDKKAYTIKKASLELPEQPILFQTMSSADLYRMNNPLWARSLKISDIISLYKILHCEYRENDKTEWSNAFTMVIDQLIIHIDDFSQMRQIVQKQLEKQK
jgi:hypothetical protein